MTKTCKKILLTVFLALCFVLCFGALIACNDSNDTNDPSNPNGADDDTVTYVVTVLKDDETPASGVKVSIRKGSSRFPGKNTDANGKAEFELLPDNYTVVLDQNTIPDHYSVPDNANLSLTKDNRSLTVTLAKEFVYTVNLVDTDGNPYYAPGVTVGVCTFEGTCKNPVALPSNGVAVIEEVANDYHVKVEGLPKDKAIPCDSENYYTGKNFSITDTEMTITVYSLTDVSALTPMTNDEKTAYATKNSLYTADSAITAYHVEKQITAGQTAYFSFTPEVDGEYRIYKDNIANYLYNGTEFQVGNVGSSAIYYALPGVLKAGKTYRFNVSNPTPAAITAEFVIEAPAASNTQISGRFASDITTTVTIAKEGANAILELSPTIGVALELTAQGTTTASIQCFESSEYAKTAEHTNYKAGAACTAKFTQDQVGVSLYFSVAVSEAASYPVELQIKIGKGTPLTDTTNTVSVTETLTDYSEPEAGTALKSAGVTAESDLNKQADGYYVNDKLVLVNVKELAYLDQKNFNIKYVLDVTSEADKADLTKGKTYSDYRLFIRGFKDYDETHGGVGGMDTIRDIPKNITTATYYAKSANTDGAYPLTEEFLTFLKAFYANNSLSGSWTNALYCYEEVSLSDDPIVGNYAQTSKWAGTTTLNVKADGTFKLQPAFGEAENGEWEKNNDGTYTFSAEWNDYTVTRDELGILTFVIDGEVSYTFKTDDVVNNYIPASPMLQGITLAVKCDGTYTLTENGNPTNGTWVKNENGTYTFSYDDATYGKIDYTVTYVYDEDLDMFVYKFHDTVEEDPDEFAYVFKVYVDPIVNNEPGYATADKEFALYVNDDGTCSLWEGYTETSGTWKNANGTYTFTITDNDGITTTYTATFNKYTGALALTKEGEGTPTYEFTVASEEE